MDDEELVATRNNIIYYFPPVRVKIPSHEAFMIMIPIFSDGGLRMLKKFIRSLWNPSYAFMF